MSNLTPEDVNLRLTETRNELQLEDTRLWQGLEDERVSRIAGDAANNNLLQNTNTALAAQEARLSVEVVQREEGDLRNITSLSELAQVLADYRIKTDLEINLERIARQQLGVDLKTRVDDFVATFDHKFLMVYQTIQSYQTSTTDSINALDSRVKTYEDMLQDITTDSIQITMDNGEINMGVWTILSQARQWDLEILAKFKNYKTQTNLSIDDALQNIQNQLPIEQNIINSALDALSNSQVIQNLDAAINSNNTGINSLSDNLLQEISDRQSDMLALNQTISNQLITNQANLVSMVEAETAARVDELRREATIRQQALLNETSERTAEINEKLTLEEGERLQQINELQDGLTQEIQHRIDGDTSITTELNNYKVSTDTSLANIQNKISVVASDTASNATAITALDTRLTTNENLAASVVNKANTALSENQAQATQISNVQADINNINGELDTKADAQALQVLDAKVTTIDGKVVSNTNAITTLTGRVETNEDAIATKLDASVISDYYTKSQTDDKAAKVAAGKVEEFRADLKIGGRNLWNPGETISAYESGGNYTHSNDVHRFLPTYLEVSGSKLLLQIWNPNKVINTANSNQVAFYTEDKTHISSSRLNLLSGETYQKQEFNIPANAKYMRLSVISGVSTYDPSIKFKFELGTVYTEWTASEEEVANSINANSTAIQNTHAEVSRVDGRVTAINSAQVLLEGRVQSVEGDVAKKADASALSSLDTRVGSVEGKYTSQASDITRLNNSLDTTNLNVDTAQAAAQDAMNAAGAKGKVIFGNTVPAVADRLVQNLWIDTTGNANTPKRWDGSAWVVVTDKVATDAAKAVSDLDATVKTKADVTALNSLTTKVTDEADKTTANTNSITTLNSDIVRINNDLSTKANASALNDIYTKQQADDKATTIAAGEISKYDANLVIGGTNLLLNSDFSGPASWSNWANNGGGYVKVTDPTYGSVLQTNLPSGLVHDWVKLENNVEYVYSALVKPSNDLYMYGDVPLHYWAGKDNQSQDKIHVLRASHGRIEAGKWTRISIVFKLVDDADSFRPFIYGLSGVLQLAWTKLERGNKATDWTPNDQEIQQSINANAHAIQTTNAEVSRINGEVVSTANSVSTLSSNVGLLQGSINEVRQTVTNNQESTNTLVTSLKSGMADADDVSMMMRNATVLHEDLSFKNGWNGVQVYNNYGNGALVSNFTDKLPDNPVAATCQIEFIHSGGATTPGLGGFCQQTQSRANGVFLIKFVAKLPVGFSFGLAANAYGDGANAYFIGGSEGTGKFKTYYGVYRCGATGSFSTVGYVYVQGSHPTPESPLIWYLASSTVYDCLDSKVAPDSVVNGIAEAKSIASTAVNKSEATALIAQNLQASLDNTNANISNNYYTKSSTDEAISNQITNLSATLGMNALPSKRDTTKANQWLLTHVVPKDAGWVCVGVKPDFSTLKTGIKNKRTYCADGNTSFSGSEYDNTVLYFRTIVYAHTDVEVNLGNFTGDDAHSIYVNGVLNFTKGSYGSTANLRLALKTGLNTIDVICYNGSGGAGFSSSVPLSSLVVNMYAPESVEEQAAATANAVSSLTTTVSNIDGRVSSQARQVTTLESSKSAIENGAIAGNDEFIVDLRDPAYNRDLYYPVLLSSFSTEYRQTIRVMSVLNGASVPPWSSHGDGFSLNAQFQMGGAGWGVIDPEIVTDNFSYSWTHGGISPLDQIGQIGESSQPFFYVRGGGYYRLSKPVNRLVQVCAPNGSVSGYYAGVLYPRPYQASTVPNSINQGLNQQNVRLQQTNAVIDGVKAVSTVSVNNNGFISGYGLISQLVNGVVQSAFGVNADYFYVGTSTSNQKKPFMVLTSPQTIEGVTYPAGTWMDVALIANATIGTAHIADASITNAKIASLDAGKITTGILDANRIAANSISAEKLVIGDTTNLWVNPYFSQNGPKLENWNGRTQWNGGISELKSKMGVQLWGRDHIAPYSTRIPLRAGESFVIEYTGGRNAGPANPLGVGLYIYDVNGSVGSNPFQYGSATWIADLGGGWARYRHTFQVWDNGSGMPAAFGCLYFQIEQGESDGNPAYWTVGDVVVRKAMGGELIVNGAITADKINVTNLSAISANLGTLITYKDPAQPLKARMVMQGSLITVYDDNNIVRVKLGLW